jgi:hypothetical protein
MPPPTGSIYGMPSITTRVANSPLEMARRAHALLVDRFPPARTRHKPLSILRQEGRRALDQLFESDYSTLPKPDRDRMVEEVLGEAAGFGPLEELFRDESLAELMVLAAAQVIARRGEGWVPTSVRFRDSVHLKSYLQRLSEIGEPLTTGTLVGGFDIRMPNGFRVLGIVPPDILDLSPTAIFSRGEPIALVPQVAAANRSGPISNPSRSSAVNNPPRPTAPAGGSTGVPTTMTTRTTSGDRPTSFEVFSGPLPMPVSRVVSMPTDRNLNNPADPNARIRQRVTERIIIKCAAAGVYDLRSVSAPELQRIILSYIEDLNGEERLGMDEVAMQRLTLEILTGMNR